jgi:hypothetical protein
MYEIMIQGPVQALMQVHTGRSFTDNCVLIKWKRILWLEFLRLELCDYFEYVCIFLYKIR